MSSELLPWSTTAINLPDHVNNAIHTDDGARLAGFERALVAGTTIYAYMTHPPVAAWGLDWLTKGGGELRLRRPVFDEELVDCTISVAADGLQTVTAEVSGDPRATLELWRNAPEPPSRDGDAFDPIEIVIDQEQANYGLRCGDDLSLYSDQGIAHPVLFANLANQVFMETLVTGPWIHVRSRLYHHHVVSVGATVRIEATLIDRFDSRAGERALVDMTMFADGVHAATVEHEAIIALP